jgi:hypothetical protein
VTGRLLLCAALFAAACNSAAPTGPSTVTLTTETFAGSLAVGSSRFYSFTIASGGTVSLTLASVSSPADGTALADPLEIGIGTPAGTGCAVTAARQTAAALTAQLQTAAASGIHCVRVSDPGGLPAPVNFALRFTHP